MKQHQISEVIPLKWDDYATYFRKLTSGPIDAIYYQQQEVLKLWAPEIIQQFATASLDDLSWFARALGNDQNRWFVLFVLERSSIIPERLFYPLVRAIIDAKDPSEPQSFVRITAQAFGQQRLTDELYGYEDYGSKQEIQGAQDGLYWVRMHFPDAKLRSPPHF